MFILKSDHFTSSYQMNIITELLQKYTILVHIHSLIRFHNPIIPEPFQLDIISIFIGKLTISMSIISLKLANVVSISELVFLLTDALFISVLEFTGVFRFTWNYQGASSVNQAIFELPNIHHFYNLIFFQR